MSNKEDRVAECLLIGLLLSIIILKLTNVIQISWVWLLCPIWLSFGLGLVLAIVFTLLYIYEILFHKEKKNERY